MVDFYRKSVADTLSELDVSTENGLTSKQVKSRLLNYGRNQLEATKKINPFKLFLSQFKDVLVIVLIIAAFVSLGLSFTNTDQTFQKRSDRMSFVNKGGVDNCATLNVTSDHPCAYSLNELGFPQEVIDNWGTCFSPGVSDLRGSPFCDDIYQQAVTDNGTDSQGLTESLLIFAIVFAIAIIGFLNEYKAEKTVEALRKLVGHSAKVKRMGKIIEVPASEIVPGDIVVLEEGKKVPADIRLIEVKAIRVNEASLTGESLPVSKNTHPLKSASSLGDQKNMLFSGTIISSGTAVGVVVGTGKNSEIGKIAHLVSEVEESQTPMQKKLDELGKKMGVFILLISIVVFIIIFAVDKEIANLPLVQRLVFAFTVAVALAVAAIPEGLSFVVRISLAFGARRMASKNALVRKLSAVEALGSTDVICSDKTGTLTKGEMTVRKLYSGLSSYDVGGTGYQINGKITDNDKVITDFKGLEPMMRIGILCNNSQLRNGAIIGDPTEGSLIVSGAKIGLDHTVQTKKFPRLDEIPFTSERKMMTTIHKMSRSYLVASKGAPDVLLEHCDRILINGKTQKLTKTHIEAIQKNNNDMAKQALRVLAFAYREIKTIPKSNEVTETKLIFVGLQGMMDPPRVEVKDVIHRVRSEAGMRIVMITGDYIETAKAVAHEIGISGDAISGTDLDKLSQTEFEQKVEQISVYARVNPEHKIRIVKALKKHGHQVAMTGDGVNDAPAIKAADIGIAMGVTGTDAAKEAADLILLDDQFLTIIDAVEEGRGIFDNVRKFVSYLLGANMVEVLIVLGGIVILKDPIFTATQLLFINIVTDGLPAIALGSDPAEKGIMRYKPHHFQGSIINKKVWIEMSVYAITTTAFMLWQFAEAGHTSAIQASSVAFMSLVTYELVRLIVLRTNYHIPWFSNPWLSVAVVVSFLTLMPVLFISSISKVFEVGPVSGGDWLATLMISLVIFVVMKLTRKMLDRFLTEAKPQYSHEHYHRVAK